MVPPEAAAVRVMDWPLSIVGLDGVIAPAESTELTVTVAALVAEALSGVEALSVTVAQKNVVAVGVTLKVVELPARPVSGDPEGVGLAQLTDELVVSWTL